MLDDDWSIEERCEEALSFWKIPGLSLKRKTGTALEEYEIKIRLSRFLFTQEVWGISCSTLSGGEKMRLMLCCLNIANQAPNILFLDQPTNNLDIQNIEILTRAIHAFEGTLIVIFHDEYFLKQINIRPIFLLESRG